VKPTNGRVFIKKVQSDKSKFELAGNDQYQVEAIGPDVTACKVGDFVLFNDYHSYEFSGETIIKVNESDIDGVCTETSS
jgi:co-chaperonin GroES (HSP10)